MHFEFADLRDIGQMRAAIDKVRAALGPITILVNNAARDDRHKFEEITPEFFDERIATNLRHQLFASQAVAPDMKAAGGGSIIMMGSTSWYIGMGGMAVYTAAKSAVLGLTRSLARDLGQQHPRELDCSGWIMTQRQIDLWVTPESIAAALDKQCLKRRLMPDDIAHVAVFSARTKPRQ